MNTPETGSITPLPWPVVSTTDQVTTRLGETALPYTSCPDAVNGGVEDPLYTVDEPPAIVNRFRAALPIIVRVTCFVIAPEEATTATLPSLFPVTIPETESITAVPWPAVRSNDHETVGVGLIVFPYTSSAVAMNVGVETPLTT